ncbi:hypothetical protein [Palleronia sp. THAF1]|uniref:hypothetical protein n=1 Tax=Palleronia sp. THAF1 TaxID=2587842 RepID=UPI0011CDE099|nr:hypothetical protein [Palleronia sp. THAF1]
MAPRTVEELIYHMPTVEQRATNDWAKGFAASVRRQSRRRNWRPSPKQVSMMRRLVSEMFTDTEQEGEIILIE